MYICVTEVDALTRIPCTLETMRTGPDLPSVKGWQLLFTTASQWPVETDQTGKLLQTPRYYGTCDNDADTTVAGVLETLTEEQYTNARLAEHNARKPFPSWVGDFETMRWNAPVSLPSDSDENGGNVVYRWDESTLSWVEIGRIETTL